MSCSLDSTIRREVLRALQLKAVQARKREEDESLILRGISESPNNPSEEPRGLGYYLAVPFRKLGELLAHFYNPIYPFGK